MHVLMLNVGRPLPNRSRPDTPDLRSSNSNARTQVLATMGTSTTGSQGRMRRSAINEEELRSGVKTAEVCLDGAPRRDRRSRSDRPLGEGKEKSSRSEEQSVDRLRARETTV